MNRRDFMKRSIVAGGLGLAATPVLEAETGGGKRPNVLMIVCDDLNRHVGPAGYPHIETPALDAFAREALTFNRAYCQYPVCGPSRASFLSGLYPETTGVLSNKTDLRETRPGTATLPEHFRRNGYWCGVANKIYHNPGMTPQESFDAYAFFSNEPLPLLVEAEKRYAKDTGKPAKGSEWKAYLETFSTQTRGQMRPGYGPSGLEDAQHKDGKGAAQVIEWIQERPEDKPFFIAWGVMKPHVPFLAPDKYFAQYPLGGLPEDATPEDDFEDIPAVALNHRYKNFGFELGKKNDALRREYMQAYHACITFIDAQIGAVLGELKRQGLWDNTVVLFFSDHGYHLGEHGMWGKVTLFEECARVPLVARVPGVTPAGETTNGLVELVDLFPTLLDICEVPAPGTFQGQSFANLLRDPSGTGKRAAYTVVTRGERLGRSLRTARWRYADWEQGDEELYDLESDPGEYVNLALNPEHARTLREMRGLMAERKRIAQ